ncbi:fldA [Symbiodinium sp. CCMP2456]|nr:fldA [Symbiodinium sp. CCMP2456]
MGAASSTESTADTTKKRSKGKSKKKAAAELQDGKRSERPEAPDAEDLQPVLPEHLPELSQTLGPEGPEWPEGCPEPRAKVPPSRPESEGLEAQETLPLPDVHFETTPSVEGEAYDNFELEGYDNFPETRERESFGVFGFLPAKKDLQSSASYRIPARGHRNSNVHSSQALRVRFLRVSVPQQSTGLPGDLADLYVKLRLGPQSFRTPCIENGQTVVDGNDFTFQLVHDSLQLEVMRVSAFRDELLCKVSVELGRRNLVAGEWRRQRLPFPDRNGEVEFELLLGTAVEVAAHTAEPKRTAAGEEELEYQVGPRMFQPKAHALPWEGVRVLELTRRTWAAALCGQMMAASGAEVIRVAFGEEALLARKKGNAPRRPLRSKDTDSLEKAKANLVPRQLHVGKRLAPLHPEDPEEMALLRSDLLTGCNVFLTDLPADELEDMQLSAQTMRSRFPHLIYIHTSCIGMLADVAKKGVNDAGAFFCLSGMAEQLGHFLGPAGFAAAVSASALFGVACMAVMRRRCGSPGDRVEMSIFRAGRWCAALGALTGWHKPQQPDLRFFVEPDTKKMLATPFDVEGVAHIRPAIRSSHPDTHIRWTVKDPASLMPGVMQGCPIASELPLARVSVIEISDEYQVSASAVGALLADLGARVTKLERPQRPDPWKRTCPQLYQDLTARKSVSVVNYSGVGGVDARGDPVPGQAALYRTLAQATILVTNLPLAALAAWGLEPKHMREMFPHLIILWITTWGCDEMARQKELTFGRKGGQEAHAFWEASGLCQAFNGNAMPPGLSELAVAQHALGGLGMALLRQQRTGAGQLVHISRYQAGLYCQSISSIEPVALLASPLLQTLDGRFLRLLGRGHQPHDAWVLLHALGRREGLMKRAGNMDALREELQGYTWEDLQKHQDELLACARNWSFQDLVKAFQEKGIDWIVEEMRPMDAEALHRQRAEQVEALRQRQQDAAEKALEMAQRAVELQRDLSDSKGHAQRELQEQLADQTEQQQKMELLREQYQTGVAPIVGVTVDGAEGLESDSKVANLDTYCVIEIANKPHTRLQTGVLEGTDPAWDFTGLLQNYAFGDVLKFAVYCKESRLSPRECSL